jgi:outer membrane protein W
MNIASLLLPLLQVAAVAPPAPPGYSRAGRHDIELGIGVLDNTRSTVTSGSTNISAFGVGGSLAYTYWFADDLGFSARVGVVSADATVSAGGSGSDVRSATVIPLFFGVKYQPLRLRGSDRLRPYLAAAMGPVFGTDAGVSAGTGGASVGSRTATALGGHTAIGLDVLASRRVTLGVGAGYRLMTDFRQAIGDERNYSGAEFIITVGLLLGGGS